MTSPIRPTILLATAVAFILIAACGSNGTEEPIEWPAEPTTREVIFSSGDYELVEL